MGTFTDLLCAPPGSAGTSQPEAQARDSGLYRSFCHIGALFSMENHSQNILTKTERIKPKTERGESRASLQDPVDVWFVGGGGIRRQSGEAFEVAGAGGVSACAVAAPGDSARDRCRATARSAEE